MAKTTRLLKNLFIMILVSSFLCAHADARPSPQRRATGNPRYAAIIMDAQSGRVLHQSSADKSLYPASLTKMMTLFLTFEALDRKRIHLDKFMTVTANATRQPPSKLGLRVNERITVKQGILALVTRSANDVSVAMAETVGGSERNFIAMMNARAASLGMRATRFENPHGLPNPRQRSSARDMAILGRALMQYFPHYYHFFKTESFVYRGQWIGTHNHLMKRYKGMDGLKTGYTIASGFNLAASAVRNNRRVIVVVFGGRTAVSRDNHVADLLNRGFAMLGRNHQNIQVAQNGLPSKKTTSAINTVASQAPVVKAAAPAAVTRSTVNMATIQPQASSQAAQPLSARTHTQAVNTTSSNQGFAYPTAPAAPTASRPGWTPDGGQVRPLQPFASAQIAPIAAVNANSGQWGIQVGAFGSAALGQQALQAARDRINQHLPQSAQDVVVPVNAGGGIVYRARIVGLSANAASKACNALPDCMAFTMR